MTPADMPHKCPKCETHYAQPQECDWCLGEVTHPIPAVPAGSADARDAQLSEALAVLRELLDAETAGFPPAEAGVAAQTAWAERKSNAKERARSVLDAAMKEHERPNDPHDPLTPGADSTDLDGVFLPDGGDRG